MTSPENRQWLPRVEETDLLNIMFEDVTDPSHRQRWEDFTRSNPELAREVLRRAVANTRQLEPMDALKYQKQMVDDVTFVFRALERAAERIEAAKLEKPPDFTNGDGVVEDLQP